MGTGLSGNYSNTKGGRILYSVNTKSSAISSTSSLPETIQKTVKSFFRGGSNNYNRFLVQKNPNGGYTAKMENPGKVPGSKAIYYKVINENGKTVRVYKETYDPNGNLIHTKEK